MAAPNLMKLADVHHANMGTCTQAVYHMAQGHKPMPHMFRFFHIQSHNSDGSTEFIQNLYKDTDLCHAYMQVHLFCNTL